MHNAKIKIGKAVVLVDLDQSNQHFYPTSTLDPALDRDPEMPEGGPSLTDPYLRQPSIHGRTIHVPLSFWFMRSVGLSLPLVALQYHDVELRLELRPLNRLYTVREPKDGPDFGKRVVPHDADHYMSAFTAAQSPSRFTAGQHLGATPAELRSQIMNTLDIRPRLLANYIFLDEEERNSFAAATHEYLIEAVQRQTFDGVFGQQTIELDLKHPVKSLVWHAQRDDFVAGNQFCNFTNWPSVTANPGSHVDQVRWYGARRVLPLADESPPRHLLPYVHDVHALKAEHVAQARADGALPTKFNFRRFGQAIIREVTLRYNGIKRFDTRDAAYYNDVQPYQHQLEGRLPGVYMYSFAMKPTRLQPSGTSNMSRVRRIQMDVDTTPVDMLDNENETLVHRHKYTVTIYVLHNNLLRIFGGMGGLGFHN
jgi:hypothetical protein